ncbi:FkbM family methyltransferase [Adhaeribacter swui]|uniref:FkbM family methyltransferase n=1 Tax=Adhaeribacter swui TaxID=2086471 RepID=A0A7G7GCW0_9BACT|nr:FkbM family methyltransferase [Adhaeribacter swui]QNF34994.1 FkbM family methyltransferase [Adhaeribacter swui]
MNRRIALAKHWFFTNKNGISLTELLTKVFEKTCDLKAKPYIKNITKEGEYYKVELKNVDGILYYPATIALRSLYQVITESTDKEQWHYYEIPETLISPTDVVVDCGAAEGLFSFLVAKRCFKVYAIEPLPAFVASMRLSFTHLNNVEIFQIALSDHPGTAFIDNNDISSSLNKTGNVPVSVQTIDNLFYHKGIIINYLKADLEGYELDMLRGATNTIKQCKPKVAITTYHNATHASEIQKFLLNIHPNYHIKFKGIEERAGAPVMLHAW